MTLFLQHLNQVQGAGHELLKTEKSEPPPGSKPASLPRGHGNVLSQNRPAPVCDPDLIHPSKEDLPILTPGERKGRRSWKASYEPTLGRGLGVPKLQGVAGVPQGRGHRCALWPGSRHEVVMLLGKDAGALNPGRRIRCCS